jgi:hypothetical protein
MGFPFIPSETNSVLVVNPNAVLALSVAFQRFQPVTAGCG